MDRPCLVICKPVHTGEWFSFMCLSIFSCLTLWCGLSENAVPNAGWVHWNLPPTLNECASWVYKVEQAWTDGLAQEGFSVIPGTTKNKDFSVSRVTGWVKAWPSRKMKKAPKITNKWPEHSTNDVFSSKNLFFCGELRNPWILTGSAKAATFSGTNNEKKNWV